jgi:hypothetical protein
MAQMFAEEADASSDEDPAPRKAASKKPKRNEKKKVISSNGRPDSLLPAAAVGQSVSQSASPRGALSPSFGSKKVLGKSPFLKTRTVSVLPVSPNSRTQKKQEQRREPKQQNIFKNKGKHQRKAKPPNAQTQQQQQQQPQEEAEEGWDLVRAPAKGQKRNTMPQQQRVSTSTPGGDEDSGRDALQAAFSDTAMSLAVLSPKAKTRSGSGNTLSKKEQEDKLRAREAVAQLSQAKQERKRKKKLQKQEQREQEMLEQIKRRREAAVNAQETGSGAKTSVHSRNKSRSGKKLAEGERYWKERREAKVRETEAELRRFMLKMALLCVGVFVLSVWALGPVGFGSVAVLLGMSVFAVFCAYYMSRCWTSVYLSTT